MAFVLIIGAKSEIAKAVARKYAENGYDLYLAARKSSDLYDFANDLKIRTQRKVKCIECDVLHYASHEAFYNSLDKKPEGVISAVGYLGNQKNAQSNFSEAQKIIDTNFTGVVSLLNVISDDFEKRKSGFIVGISSVSGDRGRKSNYLYGSAKAAFSTYLSGLRNRLKSFDVQVLTVKPGFVATQMTEGMNLPKILTAQPEEVAEDIYRAQKKGVDILYTKWLWKYIMWMIKILPERVFKGMGL